MTFDYTNYKKEIERKLSIFNDPNFIFDEKTHTYKYGSIKLDSVTTLIKKFNEPFAEDYWAKKKALELGVEKSEILNEWKVKRDSANQLGTAVHKWIEEFWLGENPAMPDDERVADRIIKFKEIYEKRLKYLIPLKPELRVFSKKWKIAGTMDQPFLFYDEAKKKILFIIGDWKSNEEFKDDSHKKGKYKKLLHPFNSLYENHINDYSIQISMYRVILEEEANIETHDGFLCHIGPNAPAKIYKAKDLREVVKAYLVNNREENDIFSI